MGQDALKSSELLRCWWIIVALQHGM